MKMRKILSVLTVTALCVSMLAGCGGGSGDSSSGGSGDGGAGSGTSTASDGGTDSAATNDEAAGDDTSPITFEVFLTDANNDVWDNPVGNAITEATGVSLEISYPVSSQGDG